MREEVAIGLDLGGTNIKAGIVDRKGRIAHRLVIPTEAYRGGNIILERCRTTIETLKNYAKELQLELLGVGIGSAGQINSANGVVMGATTNLPGWAGMRLGEYLSSWLGLPVVVDNDANAMAVGEAWVGAGRSWQHFACVTLGTGIGGSLIINGKPYRGQDGYAGEIGHHVIKDGGYDCNCGKTGCWEQYASVSALMRMAREQENSVTSYTSSENLFSRAREGDYVSIEIIERYSRYIAIGLANLVHIHNPQGIVIGGAVTVQGDFLFVRIRKHLERCVLPVFRNTGLQFGNFG